MVEDSREVMRPKSKRKGKKKNKKKTTHINSREQPMPAIEKREIQNATRVAQMICSSQQSQVKDPEEGNCVVAQ